MAEASSSSNIEHRHHGELHFYEVAMAMDVGLDDGGAWSVCAWCMRGGGWWCCAVAEQSTCKGQNFPAKSPPAKYLPLSLLVR